MILQDSGTKDDIVEDHKGKSYSGRRNVLVRKQEGVTMNIEFGYSLLCLFVCGLQHRRDEKRYYYIGKTKEAGSQRD